MKKKLFNLLYFIPLIIIILFYSYILYVGMKIKLIMVIPFFVMIILISLCFKSEKVVFKRIGILLSLFFLGYCAVMGYYDYFRWTTTIIGLSIILYFYFLNKLRNTK